MSNFVIDERRMKDSALYEHMRKILTHMLQETPTQPLSVLDSISTLVTDGVLLQAPKANPFRADDQRPQDVLPKDVLNDPTWARKYLHQVIPPKPPQSANPDDPPPEVVDEPDKGELADVVQEQQLFNEVGSGLSSIESYRLMVSLKRLLDKEPLGKVRLWGKILGIKRDYFVAEAKVDEGRLGDAAGGDNAEAPEISGKPAETIYKLLNGHRAPAGPKTTPEAANAAGTTNEFRYYVTTSDDPSEWTLLEDVLPEHILAARRIHRFFSGYLDAPVLAHPPFPGLEKHYLRAQIARITHTCTIAPKNIFTCPTADEREPEEKAKRFEVKPYTEIPALNPQEAPAADDAEAIAPVAAWFYGYKDDALTEAECWQHITAPILQTQGRTTEFKPEIEGAEAEEGEPVPIEYINPMLCEISHDRKLRLLNHSTPSVTSWYIRKAHSTPSDITRIYLAKSVLWPGAMCVARVEDNVPGATYQNLYIGRGLKSRAGTVFAPECPKVVLDEFPCPNNKLQIDCNRDDELEFMPPPPPPPPPAADEDNVEE